MYNEIKKIEKIYVINLESRTDRKKKAKYAFCQLFDKLGKDIEVKFIKAIYWKDLTSDYLKANGFRVFKNWDVPGAKNPWYRRLLKGEIALTLSYFFAWKLMYEEEINKAMFFEDDFIFVSSVDYFVRELEKCLKVLRNKEPDWDFLYLDRNPVLPDRGIVSDILAVPGYSYSSTGSILTRKGCNKLLKANVQKNIIAVDEFFPAMYCQHPRKDVDKIYGKYERLNAFAVMPNLLWQNEEEKGNIEASKRL